MPQPRADSSRHCPRWGYGERCRRSQQKSGRHGFSPKEPKPFANIEDVRFPDGVSKKGNDARRRRHRHKVGGMAFTRNLSPPTRRASRSGSCAGRLRRGPPSTITKWPTSTPHAMEYTSPSMLGPDQHVRCHIRPTQPPRQPMSSSPSILGRRPGLFSLSCKPQRRSRPLAFHARSGHHAPARGTPSPQVRHLPWQSTGTRQQPRPPNLHLASALPP